MRQGMFSLFSNEESELKDLAQAKAGEWLNQGLPSPPAFGES